MARQLIASGIDRYGNEINAYRVRDDQFQVFAGGHRVATLKTEAGAIRRVAREESRDFSGPPEWVARLEAEEARLRDLGFPPGAVVRVTKDSSLPRSIGGYRAGDAGRVILNLMGRMDGRTEAVCVRFNLGGDDDRSRIPHGVDPAMLVRAA